MFNLVRKYGPRGLALVAFTTAAIAAAPASAQGHGGGYHGGGGGYHGAGAYHGGGYRGGYRGGWHGGWGWGWGVGLGFYGPWWPGYYDYDVAYPYYPYYGDPAVTVIQQPMAAPAQAAPAAPPTYYYCDNPAGYYPYVQNCGQPWRPVPATPQPPPPQR